MFVQRSEFSSGFGTTTAIIAGGTNESDVATKIGSVFVRDKATP